MNGLARRTADGTDREGFGNLFGIAVVALCLALLIVSETGHPEEKKEANPPF